MTREEYLESVIYDEHEYIEVEDATIEMLNEAYSFKSLGGPFTYMNAGVVLKEYDYTAFRETMNNYQDSMIRNGNWIEYDNNCWFAGVEVFIENIKDAIKNVDPFQVEDSWYYYDEAPAGTSMELSQGPFDSPEDCYNHACLQRLLVILKS